MSLQRKEEDDLCTFYRGPLLKPSSLPWPQGLARKVKIPFAVSNKMFPDVSNAV